MKLLVEMQRLDLDRIGSEGKREVAFETVDAICDLALLADAYCPGAANVDLLIALSQKLGAIDLRTSFGILTDARLVGSLAKVQLDIAGTGINPESENWKASLQYCGLAFVALSLQHRDQITVLIYLSAVEQIAIPATDHYLYISEDGPVELECVHGHLQSRSETVKIANVKRFGQVALAMPEVGLCPPRDQEKLLTIKEIEGNDWSAALREALLILNEDEGARLMVERWGALVVPIQSQLKDTMASVSYGSFPGAIYTSWCKTSHYLAETLVHESDHQRHYFITRTAKIWLDDETTQPKIHRSPWRKDPRPIDGLLRGASAFVQVSKLWSKIASGSDFSNKWVAHRAIRANFQAIDALVTVSKSECLTKSGRQLVDTLAEQLVSIRETCRSIDDFDQLLESASADQAEHDESWRSRVDRDLALMNSSLTRSEYMAFE